MRTIVETQIDLANDEGLRVSCDVRHPDDPGPFPVVVILHGFKGFKDWGMFPPTGRWLAERGFASVALNASLNGIGNEPEEFTELDRFARNTPGREARDLGCVLDAVESGALGPALDSRRVGLLGHSRGGGIVTLVAARDDRVRCLVTWASISTFFRYTERAIHGWRQKGKLEIPNMRTGQILWMNREVLDDLESRRDEYSLEAACRRIQVPFLAIHGEQDEAVAPTDSERLVDWASSEEKRAVILPRTGHTFGAVHPWEGPTPAWETAVTETSDWFSRWLGA